MSPLLYALALLDQRLIVLVLRPILAVSAQIPIKNDPKANDAVTAKVTADKLREVKAGHDGT